MPVVASCRCGQRFLAQDHLLGRQVPCPACGSPLLIPLAEGPDLALAPSAVQPAARPAREPASSASNSSQMLWILGVCGTLGALIVIILVVIGFSFFGGNRNVAKAPQDDATGSTAVTPPVPRRRAPTFDRPSKPTPPRESASNPFSTSAANSATSATAPRPAEVPNLDNAVTDSPDFGKPAPGTSSAASKRGSPAVASRSLAALPHGMTAWHQQQGGSLTGILNPAKDDPTIAHLSWLTGLLPYLGYQEKFNELRLSESLAHAANLEVAKTVIPEFQNPLDDRKTWDGHPFDGLALTHFAGMSGVEDARNISAAKLPRSDPRAGVFGYSEIARPDAITDGISQTIMIVGSGRLASPWLMGGGATIRGAREPLFDAISGLGTQGISGGGTLAVMADGSVRHISTAISPAVFKALCTIHGKDSVDLDTHAPSFDVKELR